jgi:hypothetical protein
MGTERETSDNGAYSCAEAVPLDEAAADIERLKLALVEITDPTLSPFEVRAVAAKALGWDGPTANSVKGETK